MTSTRGADPCTEFPTDERLYRALRAKHRQAHRCLYLRGWRLTLPHLRRWGAGQQDAEDVFQDSITDFTLALERGAYEEKRTVVLTTLLFKYCQHKWLDQVRKTQRRQTVPLDPDADFDEPADPDETESDHLRRLALARGRLRDDQRHLLDLLFHDGLSHEEVARRLGMEVASVTNKKYRILQVLRHDFLNLPESP
mgnify:CR=1 FL=1